MKRLLPILTRGRYRTVCGQLARTTPRKYLPAPAPCGCGPHRREAAELAGATR